MQRLVDDALLELKGLEISSQITLHFPTWQHLHEVPCPPKRATL